MQKKNKKPPFRKNVSQKVPNGTMLMTRDEYFDDNNGYIKPKYKDNNKLYRDAFVIDSNRQDELVVIKVQSGGKKSVTNKNGQNEKYNPYVKAKDDKGNPIKIGEKFKRGNSKYDVSQKAANQMKKEAVKHSNMRVRTQNKKILRKAKGRK